MAEHVTINYQHFFHRLLEAMPWPVMIIDRDLVICFYNSLAVQLLEATRPMSGTKLDQLIHDQAILQLVQESIQTGRSCQGEHVRDNSSTAWKVSVTPLEHTPHQENPYIQDGGKEQATGRGQAIAPTMDDATSHAEHSPGVGSPTMDDGTLCAEHSRGDPCGRPAVGSGVGSSPCGYLYFAIAIEDLSELRRLERVRRDFITNISHELRTPLASVRLLAETLEDAIDAIQGHERRKHPREIMARMLPQAQRHRVTLGTEIQDGSTLVAADSKHIARVLVNLVHNAIKFTPSGGKVTIGTLLQTGGQTQRFFVRDTGVGIRAEELPRIFERFYKADRARSKADFIGPGGGGSGLGLAIARHVIEAHGGRIIAESTPGQGSTFSFTLPVGA